MRRRPPKRWAAPSPKLDLRGLLVLLVRLLRLLRALAELVLHALQLREQRRNLLLLDGLELLRLLHLGARVHDLLVELRDAAVGSRQPVAELLAAVLIGR